MNSIVDKAYIIKQLFTTAYSNPDFSYMIIEAINISCQEIFKNKLTKFTFNDIFRYIEIEIDDTQSIENLKKYTDIISRDIFVNNVFKMINNNDQINNILYVANQDLYNKFKQIMKNCSEDDLCLLSNMVFSNPLNYSTSYDKITFRIML
jgi:hypothetical protein